ncbi:TetR family transcriptional regulator [Agromyces humatus]|uniref:HTH tetR-type domain-containing protein n=1 Tax=Agromyces humatus TaxID=279573 RepID=A0ABP4WI34_9MICO|nr:TetR family transcriptional regulator [Agromyces humatus]
MARNADLTRARILDAATAEFSARGIAGARVDRIADAAACNKALLYSYFGNKEQLFDAVFAVLVARLVEAHPIDAEHLDEYAGALVDSYLANPELVRLALWDRLERGGTGMRSPDLLATDAAKVAAIADAQASGAVSTRFAADEALAIVTVLASILPLLLSEAPDARVRQVVTTAVARLLD